jgi:hypothetical protein
MNKSEKKLKEQIPAKVTLQKIAKDLPFNSCWETKKIAK